MIVSVISPDCRTALDVGCGQGALTRTLRAVVPEVAGVDRDERSIELARADPGAAGIGYVRGDLADAPFRHDSFDLVTAVASLHHMDAEAALREMAGLLRPGGTLVIVGLARATTPADLCLELPAVAGTRLRLAAGAWSGKGGRAPPATYTSPVIWPPPLSYRQARRLAEQVLPGVRYRRRLYWRYTLIWTKPARMAGTGSAAVHEEPR